MADNMELARDAMPPEEAADGTNSATNFSAEELVIQYPGTTSPVIEEEDITVKPGKVTALIGPNGSGKSTMLKGLANQLSLNQGTVLLDGRDVHEFDTKELARNLGLLSQEQSIPESLTVEDLIYHGRYPYRGLFESVDQEDREAVERAIDLAGISHLRDRQTGNLSGGQKQLAWIAMILAQETDVLLLDEPTTFLDLHHQLEVMEIVQTLRDEGEITVVVVLHEINQAARYADELVALKDGEIQAHGPPEAVLTEELLADVFRVDAEVKTNGQDVPQITPLRPLHEDDAE